MSEPDPGENPDLARLSDTWSRLGESDPYWAVLSDPRMKGGGWEAHLDEFLASGRTEVEAVMAHLGALGMTPRAPALELGCGVGRVTRALAEHLGEAHGVDIALPMISRARERDDPGCTYHHNTEPHLGAFADAHFGMVYSRLVFQHMAPALGRGFLRELLRVAAPGASVVVQIPAGRRGRGRILGPAGDVVRSLLGQAPGGGTGIEMHGIPRAEVEAVIDTGGGRVVEVEGDQSAGPGWTSWVYVITKDR